MSGSFASGSSNASKGGDWTGKMYFVPEASNSRRIYEFRADEVREKLMELIEPEKILRVFVYDSPLRLLKETKGPFKHSFVVLQTNNWWWSLEKNTEGITLQRDKSLAAVRDRYRQNERATEFPGVTMAIEDEGKGNMEELVGWLWEQNALNETYDLVSSNCQYFAKIVFEHVAVSKKYQK